MLRNSYEGILPMKRLSEIIDNYNQNWRDKLRAAESAVNILFHGGRFGDYLTLIFLLLYKLLERKETGNR